MNASPHVGRQTEPLEIERLCTDHQRRITVEKHRAFREALAPAPAFFDEIDEAVADLCRIEAEGGGARTP